MAGKGKAKKNKKFVEKKGIFEILLFAEFK
jgi:hypothetical protein